MLFDNQQLRIYYSSKHFTKLVFKNITANSPIIIALKIKFRIQTLHLHIKFIIVYTP